MSLFLKYLGIRKVRLPEKPLSNLVAENLYSIFIWIATIAFLIVTFGIMGIATASSEAEIFLAQQYTFYGLAIVYVFFAIFQFFYVGPKITSKPENLSPLAQYNMLRFGRKPIFIGLLGTVFLSFLLMLNGLIDLTGMQEFAGNEIFDKTFGSLLIMSISLVFISMPTMMTVSLSSEREMEISFNVIQSFEDIAKKVKVRDGLAVWKLLVKNIIYGTEGFVKRHIGISDVKFYKPFNLTSLAAIIGNDEQRNRAKEWIAQLGTILMNKELDETRKAMLILDHMEQVEQEKKFAEILQKHEKYRLHYQFESIWRRITQKFGTLERIIIILVGISTFIFTLIKFLVFRM